MTAHTVPTIKTNAPTIHQIFDMACCPLYHVFTMRRRVGLAFAVSLVMVLSAPDAVEAKRVLPQSAPRPAAGSSTARGVTATVKFKPDRRGITVTFKNLSIAADVTYSLTYVAGGIEQGVDGAVNIALGSVSKDLIFGTCSAGVCRYDTGIVNARFTVTTMLRNGKRIVKIFRLKV